MSDKPSYLGLLNAIAVGECGGEQLFSTWAAATPNDEVRAVLRTVALREGEHAKAFAKRIDELGFQVRDRPDPGLAARVAIAAGSASDCDKFERLGYSTQPAAGPDIFARFFDDTTIDVSTAELMGRYIAEERDTERRLRACYCAVHEAESVADAGSSSAKVSTGSSLDQRLCRMEAAIADLASKTDEALKATRKR